jgi:hypothetical protein
VLKSLLENPDLASLYPLFLLEYSRYSQLNCDGFSLESRTGVRQGSALGPLWFSLAIHKVVKSALQKFPAVKGYMYLDDITLVGESSDVAACAALLESQLRAVNLRINRSKSEWLSAKGTPAPADFCDARLSRGCIKALGAYIGDEKKCASTLLAKFPEHGPFFSRLAKAPADVALLLLSVCGVPAANFISRTHDPVVSAPYLKSFDNAVRLAWVNIAQVDNADKEIQFSATIAHLPDSHGGCGLPIQTAIAPLAYAASREASLNISHVRQADRVRAHYDKAAAVISSKRPEIAAHLEATKDVPFSKFIRTAVELNDRYSAQAVSAAFRLRLRCGHRDLPESIACPGCRVVFDKHSFAVHAVGCTRVHGFNASSRHAMVKAAMNDALAKKACLSVEDHEPREYGKFQCPGCHSLHDTDTLAQHHIASCADCATKRSAVPKPRRTGPDGRVFMPLVDKKTGHADTVAVVYDLTIVTPDAPSYVGKGSDAAIKARYKDKNEKYQADVVANGEAFLVFGTTCYGGVCADAESFLVKAAKASNGHTTPHELVSIIGTNVMLMSGHVLFSAERKAGIVHTEPQATQKPPSGRGSAVTHDIEW